MLFGHNISNHWFSFDVGPGPVISRTTYKYLSCRPFFSGWDLKVQCIGDFHQTHWRTRWLFRKKCGIYCIWVGPSSCYLYLLLSLSCFSWTYGPNFLYFTNQIRPCECRVRVCIMYSVDIIFHLLCRWVTSRHINIIWLIVDIIFTMYANYPLSTITILACVIGGETMDSLPTDML